MRLAIRFAILFTGLFTVLLTSMLWLAYQDRKSAAEAETDRRIFASMERVAGRCALAWGGPGFERSCLESAGYLGPMTYPAAFLRAFLVDGESRVVVRTDPLPDLGADQASQSYVAALANRVGPFRLRRVAAPGGAVRAFAVPVTSPAGRIGTWIAAYREDALTADAGPATWRFIQAALLGVGAGLLSSAVLAWFLLAPLQELADAARRSGSGDFRGRVPEDSGGEVGELAAEFNRMNGRLAELDELKESFMAQVTHDLRSPLGAMMGHAENVAGGLEGPISDQARGTLRMVVEQGRFLRDLINNILDITQLEAGSMKLTPRTLSLSDEVESVLRLMRGPAESLGIRLEPLLLPGLDEVYADPQAFSRVLTNLVSNALKFTPSGGTVTVKAYRGGSDEVVLSVRDSGIGIPRERLPGIFAKFSQVPETKNKVRPAVGTGLGLAICKELVEAQGGRIWVESGSGAGTTVSFTLPPKPPVGPTPG